MRGTSPLRRGRSRKAAALHTIARFLPEPQRAAAVDEAHHFRISYQKYDWSLNALPVSSSAALPSG